MRRNRNKVAIIVFSTIAMLLIIAGVFAYTYFCTDLFKSDQELFAKYLIQNLKELKETTTLKKVNELEEKLKQSKYEENIIISYAESEEVEPLAQIEIDTQNDSINKETYWMLSLMLEGIEDSLEVEYMKEDNMYSLRFTDAVKEFITVENSNLKELATKLGIDEDIIEQMVPDTIDFDKFSYEKIKFTDDEINTEINKYSQLIYNNIAKEKYQKNKDTVITVNGKTITTNAYRLTLNNEDLKNLGIKLLEELKQDEIILSKLEKIDEMLNDYEIDSIKESFLEAIENKLKPSNEDEEKTTENEEQDDENIVITVYEQNKETIRVKLEQGLEYITVDTFEQEGKKQIDINYTNIDEENTQLSSRVTFTRENENKVIVQFNNIEGEEQQSSDLSLELIENENGTKIHVVINGAESQITFTRNINIVDEINYKVTLDNTNSIILNDLSSEQLSKILELLGGRLNTEYVHPLEPVVTPIAMLIMMNQSSDSIGNMQDNLIEDQEEGFNITIEENEEINN